jgi:hypothetical protein
MRSTASGATIEAMSERRIEELRDRIAALVAQRQQLRSFGASSPLLEENRRQLAHSHQELSRALIESHLPAHAA